MMVPFVALRRIRRPRQWGRPPAGPVRLCAAASLIAGLLLATGASAAEPVPGKVSISTANGFARLIFRFRQEVASKVQLTGSILIIAFDQPVSIDVDRLNVSAPDYVSAAREDPDGMAVRIALAQKVTPNAMPALEQLYLDLLPAGWKGLKPSLPQEVINELARRAREADKQARMREQLAKLKQQQPQQVRVARQPTFTRYVFSLPGNVGVDSNSGRDRLMLVFDTPLRFDLADALVNMPPYIAAIVPKLDDHATSVQFKFAGKVDVRSFRERSNYVLDVSPISTAGPATDPISRLLAASGTPSQHSEPIAGLVPNPHRLPAVPSLKVPPHKPSASLPATAPSQAKPPVRPKMQAAAPTKVLTAPVLAPAAAAASPPAPERQAVAPAVAPHPQTSVAPPRRSASAAQQTVLGAPQTRMVKVEVKRQDDGIRLFFPFAVPTPSAVFRRANMLWLVFDTEAAIDVDAIASAGGKLVRAVTSSRNDGLVVRIKLDRPRLSSLAPQGNGWTLTIGDRMVDPVAPIKMARIVSGETNASVVIPFAAPQRLHRITDPVTGDTLLVVTALAPVRGLLKPQDFVEFDALATTQGIAVQPLADDILMQLSPQRVVIGRPQGLTLSADMTGGEHSEIESTTVFNLNQWKQDREANFSVRQRELFNAAVAAPASEQAAVHVRLARFYLARGFYPEATGAIDIALADKDQKRDIGIEYVLRAIAQIMRERPAAGLKDLAQSSVGNQHDAPLWRAVAQAQQHKWADARAGFNSAHMKIGTLPVELQRRVLLASARSAIEVGDYQSASNQLNDFETIGAPRAMRPVVAVLRGRIAEKLGRTGDALADYQRAAESNNRQASTQARLHLVSLRLSSRSIGTNNAITELETLSVVWRGDRTEIKTLHLLAKLYTKENRPRDALTAMRTALNVNSRSDLARSIQEEAAATFESLFLSDKSEGLAPIDALSLFYDFRDLTPMGHRGDEMIRRLAERLVSIDLLAQASELLQHQVDHRLKGAARAEVAARLATIYLMNHKPERALETLRETQLSGLANTLRDRRLLLESRALSELSHPDVALEIIANIKAPPAGRLRADILWDAHRWRDAAEQFERLLGSRWREWQPLDDRARSDVLRAGIGYALADDAMGLGRLRDRYSAKMLSGPDAHAFEVITSPIGAKGAEFRNIATKIGSFDTLDAFLRDMRQAFAAASPGKPASPNAIATQAMPKPTGEKPQS